MRASASGPLTSVVGSASCRAASSFQHASRSRSASRLPIGNLTSQFFANVYLDRLDHFVKEVLRTLGYVRYVDDFALFHDCPERLAGWWRLADYNVRRFAGTLRSLRARPMRIKQESMSQRGWPTPNTPIPSACAKRCLPAGPSTRRAAPPRHPCPPGEPRRWLEQQHEEHPFRQPQKEHARQPEQQPGVPSFADASTAGGAATTVAARAHGSVQVARRESGGRHGHGAWHDRAARSFAGGKSADRARPCCGRG